MDQQQSQVSAKVPWTEGQEIDFKELHEALKAGKTQKETFAEIEQTDSFQDIPRKRQDSSSEEDETEPDQPGPRLLWAAQHDKVELIKDLLLENPDLIHFSDSDGYTALHRAAYSGSKVRI